MALTKIGTDGIKDDAITKAKIPANQIEASELADNAVDTNAIADQAVALSKLPHGTSSNDGKFLRANNGADPSFETVSIPAGTTINNNADNRVITGSGTANTLNGESNVVIDSSGRLILGTAGASRNVGDVTSQMQVEGTGFASSSFSLISNAGASAGNTPHITMGKSRGSSAGSNTIVVDGDALGQFQFAGADGTDCNSVAASIIGRVDGTPGSNDMPGALTFGTAADGAASPTERMRIDSSGRVGIGTSSPTDKLHVNGTSLLGGNTYLTSNTYISSNKGIYFDGGSSSANYLDDYEEGSWTPVVKPNSSSSAWTYGSSDDYELRSAAASGITDSVTYTKIGNRVFISFSIYFNTAGTTRVNISLPFAIKNNDYQVGGHIGYYKIAGSAGAGFLGNGLNSIDIFELDGDGNHPNLSYATNSELYINLQYETN